MDEEIVKRSEILVLDIQNLSYGIEMPFIAEILRNPKLSPMPWLPDYYEGVCSFKGSILPVVSFPALAGENPQKPPRNEKNSVVIVLNGREFDCGFLVEAPPYILSISEEDRLDGDDGESDGNILRIKERYSSGGKAVWLLDIDEMLNSLVVCE